MDTKEFESTFLPLFESKEDCDWFMMSLSSALFLSENKFHHIINLVGKEESDCDKFLHIMKKIIGWSTFHCSERKNESYRKQNFIGDPCGGYQIIVIEDLENYYPNPGYEHDFIHDFKKENDFYFGCNFAFPPFPILRGLCGFNFRRLYNFTILKSSLTMSIVINTKLYEKILDPGCFKNIRINTITAITMKEFQPNVSRTHEYLTRVYLPLVENKSYYEIHPRINVYYKLHDFFDTESRHFRIVSAGSIQLTKSQFNPHISREHLSFGYVINIVASLSKERPFKSLFTISHDRIMKEKYGKNIFRKFLQISQLRDEEIINIGTMYLDKLESVTGLPRHLFV